MILSAAGMISEKIDRVVERIRGRLVKFVEEVKAFRDQIQADMFGKANISCQTHV